MRLHERIEDVRQLMFRDTHPGVFDFDRNRIRFRKGCDSNRDGASVGIFDCVLEQIADHFLDADRVASDLDWLVGQLPVQLQSLLPAQKVEGLTHVGNEFIERQVFDAQRLFGGFQARVNQDLVDHVFKMARLLRDDLEYFLVFVLDLTVQAIRDAFDVPDNHRQRGA